MAEAPVDVVDRHKAVNLHGRTWHAHMDPALEELSRLYTERDNAIDSLMSFLRDHPEHEANEHLVLAALALL